MDSLVIKGLFEEEQKGLNWPSLSLLHRINSPHGAVIIISLFKLSGWLDGMFQKGCQRLH